jgi:hypothetical protein
VAGIPFNPRWLQQQQERQQRERQQREYRRPEPQRLHREFRGRGVLIHGSRAAEVVGGIFGALSGAITGAVIGIGIGILVGLVMATIAVIVMVLTLGGLGAVAGAEGDKNSVGGALGGLIIGGIIGYYIGVLIAGYVFTIFAIGGIIICGACGIHLGIPVGQHLSERKGAILTSLALSAITSVAIGVAWAVWVMLEQQIDISEAGLFVLLVTIAGTTIGGVLGALGFWIASLLEGERVPSTEKWVALISVPIGVVLSWLLFSTLPAPQRWLALDNPLKRFVWQASSPPQPPGSIIPASPSATSTATRYVQVNANLREGPGKRFRILTVVSKGKKVTLLSISPDQSWARVRLPEGTVGYIHRRLLGTAPP